MKTLALVLAMFPCLAPAQTAAEIMAKVAESQTRAEFARTGFVYRQDILVRLHRSGGELAREEDREYSVTPTPDGVKRDMVHFAGKYGVGNKEVSFSEPGLHYKDLDVDADLAKSLADDFGNDDKSRDGINHDLFPLTAQRQTIYNFTLAGTETWHDRPVYRIDFEPKPEKLTRDTHEDTTPWAGEVLVDRADLTPVLVTTHLAKGVPILVKTLLGTDIQQLGFKVTYGKFDDGLWFPVSYSGELKVRALFLYARTISLGMVNSGFQKADVKSTIVFEDRPAGK